ncbi:IS701 family transposase [Winogradskya humida]|uniref:Transposase n=1 Tax=Winogradskya humida TaxID=113566 RepID=A0ABQ3ZZJ1_9ACTN|nr:IS701 family transposase [Actinoplanes humidus]GIE23874.1 transposase [Actinoplanes humidus]
MAEGIDIGAKEWDERFESLFSRIAEHFGRAEPRQQARSYLKALLSPVRRKNGWQLAEAAGDIRPDRMQRLLNSAKWDVDRVRDELRHYVTEQLGGDRGVLVVVEAAFAKKGKKSAGVQWQRVGSGDPRHCQVAVFLVFAGPRGCALIDRELHLPRQWTEDPQRCSSAGVPTPARYHSRDAQGAMMIDRALAAGAPVTWIALDRNQARARELRHLQERGEYGLVLEVDAGTELPMAGGAQRADALIGRLSPAFQGIDGDDQQWARITLRGHARAAGRWLLCGRSLDRAGSASYHLCVGPTGTSLTELVAVVRSRERAADCVGQACASTGLDQYQVRRYSSWYRHATLSMAAYAYVVTSWPFS